MDYAAVLNIGASLYRGWQIWNNRNSNNLYWRPAKSDASAWGSEHLIIDNLNISSYNAGSATKLQTARTIWGQSFDGSGNVDGTLHVKSSGNAYTQGIRIYQNNTGFAGVLLGSSTLTATTNSDANSWFISTDSNSYFSISKGGCLPTDSIALGYNGNWLINGGNVGIGTTSPEYKLDVSGASRSQYMYFLNTSLNGNAGYIGRGSAINNDIYLLSSGSLHLGTNNIDSRVFINTSGNIGIGTTSPTHPLQIYKSSTTNGDMIRLDSNSSWCGIVYRPSGGYIWSLNAGNPDTFNFWNNYIGGNAMEIKQTGNVWIRGSVTSGGFYNKNGDSAQTSSYMWGLYQWGNKIQMTRRNASTEAY